MIRNYFYIFRNILELNALLKNRKIIDVYSQEKDALFLQLDSPTAENSPALVISTNFQFPYILLKNNQKKAKKNFAEFCTNEIPIRIKQFSIANNDRIVKISGEPLDIYFVLRGPKTNVIFVKENQWIRGFKNPKNENELNEIYASVKNTQFTTDAENYFLRLKKTFGTDTRVKQYEKEIKEKFPQFNKEIFLQFSARKRETVEELIKTAKEILEDDISVYLTESKKVNLAPYNWQRETEAIEKEFVYAEFQPALAKYVTLKYKFGSFSRLFSEIEKKINRDLEYFGNRLNNLQSRVERGSRENEFKQTADILLANLHSIKKGMKEISLHNFFSGELVKIKLDEKLSPNRNVERYYEKARDEKINFAKSQELLEQTKKKYYELLEIKKKLTTIDETKSLLEIKKTLKLNDAKKRNIEEKEIKYRKFLVDGKYQVFVGKDSKSNDALTLKFAKQNDLWFHARGVSGSHVILRIENTKEAVPKSVLKSVASIAAYFSKAKTAKLSPVSYTFRKFVHKKKGMPPGQVTVSRETVLIVPPEIPKNAEEIYD